MLHISAEALDLTEVQADLLVVPSYKGGIEGPGTDQVLRALGLDQLPATPDFRGDSGQHLLLAAPGMRVGGVLLVGLGRMVETSPERLRRAAAVAARAARGATSIATTLAEVHPTSASVEAVAEGLWLGSHEDQRFRSNQDGKAPLGSAIVLVPASLRAAAEAAIGRARVYAQATLATRDLVNLPPGHKTPDVLADALVALATPSCQCTVWDEDELAERGFGGTLAVGKASAEAPRVVELHYQPPNPLGHVVLAGKGVTFDAGGLSLKRPEQMTDMKADMAGAATVAAVCSALGDLDVRLEVTALLPLVQNVPGADAQRPDDVIRVHGGTTVEVTDTDAEGRLILADALAWGAALRPDAIVDVATLTGAAVTALGRYAAALFGTDDDLLAALREAAGIAGEDLWPMPLWDDLDRFLASPVADLRNIGDGPLRDPGGGAVTAALFLRRFVDDIPWAHLDLAGPAFLPPELAPPHLPAGGTGYGVRTLLAWLERRAD